MDYQEAIEVINNHERYVGVKYVNGVEEAYVTPYFEKALSAAISAMQELQEYKQLGTLEVVRDAVYRREPLKIKIGEKYNKGYMSKAYFCNHCNKFICFKGIEKSTTICHTYLFCNNCGQKLDWGEEE